MGLLEKETMRKITIQNRIAVVKELGNQILMDMPLSILKNFHQHIRNVEENFVRIHNLQLNRRVQRFVISLMDDDQSEESEDEVEISDNENSEIEELIENEENIDPSEIPTPSPNLQSPSPKKLCPFPFY